MSQNFLDAVYIKAKSYNPRQIICIDDPTSAHSKGIGRQSEFSNRELAEKKFEIVYGAATNDWSPRINSVNNILVRMCSSNCSFRFLIGFTYLSISLDILAPISIQIYCSASITSEVLQFLSG
jgi:hypothetical protein